MGTPHVVHTFTVGTFSCTFAGLLTAQETVTRTCLAVCCLCSCSAARIHGDLPPKFGRWAVCWNSATVALLQGEKDQSSQRVHVHDLRGQVAERPSQILSLFPVLGRVCCNLFSWSPGLA